jgi:hypothetical protein
MHLACCGVLWLQKGVRLVDHQSQLLTYVSPHKAGLMTHAHTQTPGHRDTGLDIRTPSHKGPFAALYAVMTNKKRTFTGSR